MCKAEQKQIEQNYSVSLLWLTKIKENVFFFFKKCQINSAFLKLIFKVKTF